MPGRKKKRFCWDADNVQGSCEIEGGSSYENRARPKMDFVKPKYKGRSGRSFGEGNVLHEEFEMVAQGIAQT